MFPLWLSLVCFLYCYRHTASFFFFFFFFLDYCFTFLNLLGKRWQCFIICDTVFNGHITLDWFNMPLIHLPLIFTILFLIFKKIFLTFFNSIVKIENSTFNLSHPMLLYQVQYPRYWTLSQSFGKYVTSSHLKLTNISFFFFFWYET